MDIGAILDLAPHGPDTFVGSGPQYPWGGLYGGQIVAQALRAAANTVDDGFAVHSLRAYFIRRGDHNETVRYEVDRLRNGKSFCTRRVVARQAIGAILNLEASFQTHEDGADIQTVSSPRSSASARRSGDGGGCDGPNVRSGSAADGCGSVDEPPRSRSTCRSARR